MTPSLLHWGETGKLPPVRKVMIQKSLSLTGKGCGSSLNRNVLYRPLCCRLGQVVGAGWGGAGISGGEGRWEEVSRDVRPEKRGFILRPFFTLKFRGCHEVSNLCQTNYTSADNV